MRTMFEGEASSDYVHATARSGLRRVSVCLSVALFVIGCDAGGESLRDTMDADKTDAGSPASPVHSDVDAEIQSDARLPVLDASAIAEMDARPSQTGSEAGVDAGASRLDAGASSAPEASSAEAGQDAHAEAGVDAGPPADAGTGATDSALPDASSAYAKDFNTRLTLVIEQTESPASCAAVFPARGVASSVAAIEVVRGFIAQTRRVPAQSLSAEQVLCGGNTGQTCARQFQHHIYKSSGSYGEALYPFALELEQRGAVDLRVWVATVDGITQPADISFVAIVEGQALGMVVFNALDNCRR